jgi:voltage-gated potassium channel
MGAVTRPDRPAHRRVRTRPEEPTVAADETPKTLDPDPDEELTASERFAGIVERRLDIPMAILAVFWTLFIAYDLVAPEGQRAALAVAGNVIWVIFIAEFLLKLGVSGHPLRFLRRRWPSVLFLILPALRLFRVFRAIRALRALPAARVVGSSYRAIGTARGLLEGRIGFLLVTTGIASFSGGQLLFLLERGREGGVTSLGDALYWSTTLAISGSSVFEPVTVAGRLLSIALSAYAVVVFASVAAALGAFFVESRAERAAAEEDAA